MKFEKCTYGDCLARMETSGCRKLLKRCIKGASATEIIIINRSCQILRDLILPTDFEHMHTDIQIKDLFLRAMEN